MEKIKTNKLTSVISFAVMTLTIVACKDELNVGNPNAPSIQANIVNEKGLTTLAKGVIYTNGFQNGENVPAYTWLGDSYFSLNYGYSDLLGDMIGADAANELISVINVPDYVILDDGVTKIVNTSPNIPLMRKYNTRAQTGAGYNPTYFQWLNAYAMINGCNIVLSHTDAIPYTGDKVSKANTIKAWCYWWKGWAYAAVGSLYYSGLIIDTVDPTNENFSLGNNNYVLHDQVIAASDKFYTKADSILGTISNTGDYSEVLGAMIPSYFHTGHGNPPTIAEWKRNIKSMLARNILVNKLSPFVNGNLNATIAKSSTTAMTPTDWGNVLTLATAGIQSADNVFSGVSGDNNPVFSTGAGTVSAMSVGTNDGSTFKISERLIQNFKAGDKRLANFDNSLVYSNRNFGTRWSLNDGGATPPPAGTIAYGNLNAGEYECFIGSSYEENMLMIAEAKIRLASNQAQIDDGLTYVDAVRAYQGAGVAAVSGTNLTQTQALTELVKERRVALVFRGLSFYDARRWGWIYDIANGGGSYGNKFLHNDGSANGVLNTNTTISYNFLDYWDVPADETVLNPPSSTSAAVKNPNF